jgi:hypothetical protein
MDTNKPFSPKYLKMKAEDARRANEAKCRYAEKHGLSPVTLKPFIPTQERR